MPNRVNIDFLSMCSLQRTSHSHDDLLSQSPEMDRINSLRNLRKIHVDDEGRMIINDDQYEPILYHPTRPLHPSIQSKQCPMEYTAVPKSEQLACTNILDAPRTSGEQTRLTGNAENYRLTSRELENHQVPDRVINDTCLECDHVEQEMLDNITNLELSGVEQAGGGGGAEGAPGPAGLPGNMKKAMASFFENIDDSDGTDSATTEGKGVGDK